VSEDVSNADAAAASAPGRASSAGADRWEPPSGSLAPPPDRDEPQLEYAGAVVGHTATYAAHAEAAAVGGLDVATEPSDHLIDAGDGEPVHHAEGDGDGEEEEEEEGDEEENEENEENLPLRKAIKKRLIQLEGMDPGMKILIGVGLAELLVAATLLALRNISLPSIIGDQTSATDVSDIPDVAFALSMIGFCGAWSLLLAGAYRGGWLIRLLFMGGFAWAFWEVRDIVSGMGVWPPVICGIMLGLVIVLGIVTYFPEKKFRDGGGKPGDPVGKGLHRLRIWTPILLFILIGGACLIAFLYSVHYDHSSGVPVTDFGSAVTGFTTTFSWLLYNHQYVLIPILVLAGSEFGEWGDFVSRWVVRRLQRPARKWLLPAVALIAAGAMLWDGMRTAADPNVGGGIRPELLLGAILVGTIILLMIVAKPQAAAWSSKIPFVAVGFVAIADTVVGFIAVERLDAGDPLLNEKIYAISALLWMGLGAVSLIALVVRRGRLNGAWVNALIFIVLVGATEGLQAIPYVGTVVHPFGLSTTLASDGSYITNGSWLGMEGLRSVFAIVTIALVIAAIAARKLEAWRTPIAISLVLLGALQVVTWFDSLFGKTTNVTGSVAVIAAVVLVLAITWEFLSSGEAVTNHHDSHFSRSTRIYVYLGYVLLVAVSVLYYSDLHVHGSHNLIESQFDSEEWVREGILFLGVPLVIAIATARFQRWRLTTHSSQAPAVEELAPIDDDAEAATGTAAAPGAPGALEPLG
jgi:hypothetical protein